MARKLRLQNEGAKYHVSNRGNHREGPARKALDADAGVKVHPMQWEAALEAALRRVDKTRALALAEPKSAPWKIAVAAYLKITTTVSNPWLAAALHMGAPAALSRYVAECRTGLRPETAPWLRKISKTRPET